jgi:hypothetical protein
MGTTWNIDVLVTPKKGKEDMVRKKLENSEICDSSVEINQEWVEKGKKRVEFIVSCKEERAGYNYGEILPKLLADELKNNISEGKVFMKEVEPPSGVFPADVFADLITRRKQVRSDQLFEEVI